MFNIIVPVAVFLSDEASKEKGRARICKSDDDQSNVTQDWHDSDK